MGNPDAAPAPVGWSRSACAVETELQRARRLAPDREERPRRRIAVAVARQLLLLGGAFAVYEVTRSVVTGSRTTATDNAELVRQLEAALHLPSEASVQSAWGSGTVLTLADVYYVSAHFTMATLFLLWGFLRRPAEEYRWARNLLLLQTAGALVLHVTFPLAPPRMFPGWGFVDTMDRYGPTAYSEPPGSGFSNQYAAMPSLHVGWAVLIFFVVARTGPRLVGVLAGVHALTTLVVVTVTANHWWLDSVVAVGLLGVADLLLQRPGTLTRPPGGATDGDGSRRAGASAGVGP